MRITVMFGKLGDFLIVLKSGIFMHSAYAERYLGGRNMLWLALFHYILYGEAEGNYPNPFYDPTHARSNGINSFGKYLRDPCLWMRSPSPHFDPAYYGVSDDQNPLLDFIRRGIGENRHPSASFDTAFFKNVVAFYRPDKLEYAYEIMTLKGRLSYNERDFKRNRVRFLGAIKFSRVRQPLYRRDNLVFIQGRKDQRNEYSCLSRSFDVLLNDYQPPSEPQSTSYDATFDWIIAQRGTKTSAIHKILTDAPDVFASYDHILFLDDDVTISLIAIEQLFHIVGKNKLDLAQAALTSHSHCAFDILKQPRAKSGVTPVTSIEIMMPVISQRVLRDCGWVFGEGVSGWAVDFLLSAVVREQFGNTIALVGDVVAEHLNSIDTAEGAFYKFLRNEGIEATAEAGCIAIRYGIEVSSSAVRRHNGKLQGEDCF